LMRFPKLIKTRAQKSDRGRGARQTGRKSSNGLRPLASLAPRAAQCASARHWTTSRVVPPRCAAGAGRPCPSAARPRDTFRLGTGRREVGGPNRTGARAWRRPPPPRTRRRRRDAAKKHTQPGAAFLQQGLLPRVNETAPQSLSSGTWWMTAGMQREAVVGASVPFFEQQWLVLHSTSGDVQRPPFVDCRTQAVRAAHASGRQRLSEQRSVSGGCTTTVAVMSHSDCRSCGTSVPLLSTASQFAGQRR
jgi:hypothetical protein